MADKVTTAAAQIVQTTPEVVEAPVSSGFVTLHVFNTPITIYPMAGILLFIAFMTGFWLWRAQRNRHNDFDAFDLLMDEVPVVPETIKTRRKASIIKGFACVALGTATWVVIDREIKGTLTYDIFGIYCSVVVLTVLSKLLFDKPFDPQTILAMFSKKKDD